MSHCPRFADESADKGQSISETDPFQRKLPEGRILSVEQATLIDTLLLPVRGDLFVNLIYRLRRNKILDNDASVAANNVDNFINRSCHWQLRDFWIVALMRWIHHFESRCRELRYEYVVSYFFTK